MLLIGCLLFTDTGVDTKLLFTRGIFVDVGGHERGQTFRPVVNQRYRQDVTLKRTYIIVALFWISYSVGSLLHSLDHRITS